MDFLGLDERLGRLAERAPVPTTDTSQDVRRGRLAVQRRRMRRASGLTSVAAAIVVTAAVVAGAPHDRTGNPHDIPVREVAAPTSLTAFGMDRLCSDSANSASMVEPWKDPAVAPTLRAYRNSLANGLDMPRFHIDPIVSNVQFGCDGAHRLVDLGTKLGWRDANGLGDVQVEVVAKAGPQAPQIVMQHDGWRTYSGVLPTGIRSARYVDYPGGRAFVAERVNGLLVAFDAQDVWGNNAAPGAPPAVSLPRVRDLAAIASSTAFELPKR